MEIKADLKSIAWSTETYRLFLSELTSAGVPSLREFSTKLIPGAKGFIGLKTPDLRRLAKGILSGDWRGFLSVSGGDFFEERALQAYVIGGAAAGYDERTRLIRGFIPKIDNWAVNDALSSSMTFLKKEQDLYFDFILSLNNGSEFGGRIVLTTLLEYYLSEKYIDRVLKTANETLQDFYNTKMGNAWLISVAFVKQRDKTLEFLRSNNLDRFTQNKAIQKIRESYRVSDEDKKLVLEFKKNAECKMQNAE
ncbi:MAG: DNA alkylation repair protein [Clostridiales bacterium]|jgi:3-methyladenine DNA glycosylase AlkD|nr:DNA alkylation repair protein [Clostridiales bacterium]